MKNNVMEIKTGSSIIHYERYNAGLTYVLQQKQDMYVNIRRFGLQSMFLVNSFDGIGGLLKIE